MVDPVLKEQGKNLMKILSVVKDLPLKFLGG